MFDMQLPEPDEVQSVDDHTLAAAIAGWARVEAAAAARRLAVIAELTARRISDAGACSRWACDGWDAAAAEIAAAAKLTRGRASNQMYLALALRNRLPKIAALFADGVLSAPIVATIAWHTTLVEDLHALAVIDTTLAFDALHYGQLSLAKTIAAIHAVIAGHDPDALRRTRTAARDRDLTVALNDTEEGTTGLWGRLYAHDAVALDRRLAAMAHGVCDDDPRTIAQRRADALGALAAGNQQLVCACENADCPRKTSAPQPAGGALIYVLADATAAESRPDVHQHGEKPQTRPSPPGAPLTQDREPKPDRPTVTVPPAQILGGPLIPAAMLAELIRAGATVRPLWIPAADTPAEPHYRPSARLTAFIRCRDMTCRFPGCDRPAEHCDIDHAIAYADRGPTHPCNLRCLCRHHHLLKTFWGWHDKQYPDGRIDWTSPTGHVYTSYPGAIGRFPALCRPVGQPPPTPPERASTCRTLMMPTRKRTRTQNRAAAIKAERKQNQRVRQASQQTRTPAPSTSTPPPRDNDPPPF